MHSDQRFVYRNASLHITALITVQHREGTVGLEFSVKHKKKLHYIFNIVSRV